MNREAPKETPRTDRITTIEILREDKEWLEKNIKIEGQRNYLMFRNFIEVAKKYKLNIKEKILEMMAGGS